MHKKIQIAAWKIYQYYSKIKENWNEPSSWQLLKIKRTKFLDLIKGWKEIEKEILLTFSNLNHNHMTKDHIDRWYVSKNNHIKEDHIDG